MNLATPPFDDIHIRRAVAFSLDRPAIEQAFGGEFSGLVTGHLALDSMEDNALINYDPYRTKDAATHLRMAQQEMAQSRYDSKHAGTCDATVCQHVVAVAFRNSQTPPAMDDTVRTNLEAIGIHADITGLSGMSFFAQVTDPAKDPAMALFWGYGKDYPNGADFFVQLFSRDALDSQNDFTLIGATPEELHGWGYSVDSVPSVQDRIDACLPLVGDPQRRCWTSLDQYMMEKVVAVLPFDSETYDEIVPTRLASYSYDQSVCAPALDRIAIAR
jgi:ABC-type transport system substrate-binding protein